MDVVDHLSLPMNERTAGLLLIGLAVALLLAGVTIALEAMQQPSAQTLRR